MRWSILVAFAAVVVGQGCGGVVDDDCVPAMQLVNHEAGPSSSGFELCGRAWNRVEAVDIEVDSAAVASSCDVEQGAGCAADDQCTGGDRCVDTDGFASAPTYAAATTTAPMTKPASVAPSPPMAAICRFIRAACPPPAAVHKTAAAAIAACSEGSAAT